MAAVQAFAQANADFFAAVADYNRAQFRLYRALGHPAQCLANNVPGSGAAAQTGPNAAQPTPPAAVPPVPAVVPERLPDDRR